MPRSEKNTSELTALIVSLCVLVSIAVAMASCGNDIFFPGDIPPTSTAVATSTSTP